MRDADKVAEPVGGASSIRVGPAPTPTPEPTPTPTPTAAPFPEPTATPTLKLAATATPEPTATPIAAPEPTPTSAPPPPATEPEEGPPIGLTALIGAGAVVANGSAGGLHRAPDDARGGILASARVAQGARGRHRQRAGVSGSGCGNYACAWQARRRQDSSRRPLTALAPRRRASEAPR